MSIFCAEKKLNRETGSVTVAMIVSIKHYTKGPHFLCDEETQTMQEFQGPPPHKWLPHDRVDEKGNVLARNTTNQIVGIIDFANRTGQGFTSRNVPLYMFHPLQKSYPPMIVASKTNPKQNQLATVNFEHWENKWPRAGIQKILGPVGNIEVEKDAHILALKKGKQPTFSHIEKEFPHHKEYDAFVFNVDPDGCEDVDDVFMFKATETGQEFGIGIADVSAWVEESSEIDAYAKSMGQTLYVQNKPKYPMLPEILSNRQASLRADSKKRPVLSRIYEIQNDQVRSVRWELQLVKIQTSFTYESLLEDKELSQKLQTTLRILDKDVSNDSHEWVEIAMILYNTAAASVLKQHNVGLLRSQPEGIEKEMWAKLAEQTNLKELAFFGYGAGKYVPANSPNTQHVGLHVEEYTHASSPLRRYADLYNQRWLKHILFNFPKPNTSVSSHNLNDLSKEAKQLDRDLWFLENLEPGKITEQEGYVVKIKAEDVTVYVPAWKRKVRAKPAHIKDIGDKVIVRAYTDLRAVGSNRLVCSCV